MTTEFSTHTLGNTAGNSLQQGDQLPLSEHIKFVLENYFNDLDGHEPAHLYQLVLHEIERPLLESVMKYTRGNQSRASIVLGLNRGTLRKKLKQYEIS